MGLLNEYIEQAKEKMQGYSDIEKIRKVYVELGEMFQFDINFSFGNAKERMQIYSRGISTENLEKNMENKTVICKSLSYLFEYIMKKIGVSMTTVVEDDGRRCKHVFNILETEQSKKYKFDLQEDMRFIKARMRTRNFGVAMQDGGEDLVSRQDLSKIDKKIGYISKEKYYTDEYLELLKLGMNLYKSLIQKMEFLLENLDEYTDPDMKYPDRRWRMEDLIGTSNMQGLMFSDEEKNKINIVDCYQEIEGKKEYKLCITVQEKGKIVIFMFDENTNFFKKLSLEEFAELVKNGLVNMQGIWGLKQVLKSKKQEERE